jgi:hypothetical protein
MHGGHLRGWFGPRDTSRARAVVAARQAEFKRLGIPWYGRALRPAVVRRFMAEAVVIAERAIEIVSRPVDGLPEVMREAMLDSLTLQHKTVKAVERELDAAVAAKEEGRALEVDLKLLRLGNDVAGAVSRLGMRAIEGEFRARHDDVLGALLREIAAARGVPIVEEK